MRYEERVPSELFKTDGHYLGRPADFDDRIVQRRIRLVQRIPGFIGADLSLLDIGCGNGASIFGLCDQMKHCVGVDINDEHLSEFNSYKDQNNITNCAFKAFDIGATELPDQFDRIISFEVIEHLTSEDAVGNYYKALKPGGLMAISVPNKWWIFETHGAKLPLLPWNRVPFFSWLPRPLHEKWANARIYTKKRITRLLKKHGFSIVSAEYVTAPMDVLPDGKLKDFVIKNIFDTDTTSIPFKATSLFVVARKL